MVLLAFAGISFNAPLSLIRGFMLPLRRFTREFPCLNILLLFG